MTAPAVGEVRGSPVVLVCGVVGSGRTTHTQRLEAQGYVRLSIDEEVWRRFGRYGIDYHPASTPPCRGPPRTSCTGACWR